MSKKACWVTILTFMIFITAFFVLNLVMPDKSFSDQENRVLTKMPTFSFNSLFEGNFTSKYENYLTDQFAFRDDWITMKAGAELALGKKENNEIYYCNNGSLIKKLTVTDWSKLKKNIKAVSELMEQSEIPVCFALIPSAAEIQSDKLPDNAVTEDEKKVISEAYAAVGNNGTADVLGALEAHRDEYIFYRTDHHWTTLGAYYGYSAIAESLNLKTEKLDTYNRQTVSDSFFGTLYSKSGFTWVNPDTMETFVDETPQIKVTNYSDGTGKAGLMYDKAKLETKDKYSMFFGGNTPLLKIETGNGQKKLLILRDSYMDSMMPFLFKDYSEIHVMDLRYYHNSLKEYIADNKIDNVLVCYSVDTFVNNSDIAFISK